MERGKHSAFTLIELLVVIVVITVLVGILLPFLARIRKQARTVVCQANLRQWAVLFDAYMASYTEGKLPPYEYVSLATPRFWMSYLNPGGPEMKRLRCCPEAKTPANPDFRSLNPKAAVGATFRAWGKMKPWISRIEQEDAVYVGSYGINSWVSTISDLDKPTVGMRMVEGGKVRKAFWGNLGSRYAEQIPLFLDSGWWCAWPKSIDTPPPEEDLRHPFPCGCEDSIRRFCMNRHSGYVNAVFLNGTSRRVGLKELWTLKWSPHFRTNDVWTRAGGVQPDAWPVWMRRFKEY